MLDVAFYFIQPIRTIDYHTGYVGIVHQYLIDTHKERVVGSHGEGVDFRVT
jgi:hypothetical protein